jgi:hypothetical protein
MNRHNQLQIALAIRPGWPVNRSMAHSASTIPPPAVAAAVAATVGGRTRSPAKHACRNER